MREFPDKSSNFGLLYGRVYGPLCVTRFLLETLLPPMPPPPPPSFHDSFLSTLYLVLNCKESIEPHAKSSAAGEERSAAAAAAAAAAAVYVVR